jgi:uncharacterized ion transporter superfamily protein YfcC
VQIKSNSHQASGTVLSIALIVIIALSILMSASYSFVYAQYVRVKKDAALYYTKLNSHNAEYAAKK